MSKLTPWDPFKELSKLSSLLSSPSLEKPELREWAPAVDISEDDKHFIIKADLPEVKKEDIKVTVEHGYLTLSGERKFEKEEEDKKKKFHRIERSYGSYTRSFALPSNVDAASVKADFKDGVLQVVLPKIKPDKGSGKIDVAVS